ncbi:hypothetical protein BGI30_02935 [Snodgrassella alvi]|nr:hypothetical protein BGI30_02935 [Snodgrassella alvi]PIT57352.1 hypothetical protein BHC59_04475 [Snodgrassella alvi]
MQQFEICESWVKKNIGNNPEKIAIIIAKGDLMRPTFNDGDLLFVDTAIHFYVSDGIYVFFTDNGLRVKRLQLLFNGDYRITSDNHIAYAPETIPHNDLEKTYICGRVVAHWAIHKL